MLEMGDIMKIFLCGGGSGEKTILANKELDRVINHNKPILYVPLAMDKRRIIKC